MSLRHLALLSVAVTAVLTAPAMAAIDKFSGNLFGGANCGGNFSCSTLDNRTDAEEILPKVYALANSCVRRYFGMRSDKNFDENQGIDYDRCLTSLLNPKAGLGLTMQHYCCFEKTGDDTCQLKCKLLGESR